MMKGPRLVPVLFVLSAGLLFSFDFGLLADQKIEAEENTFSYSPALTPWFSWDGGRGLSLYFSGTLSFKYHYYDDGVDDNDGWDDPALLPELSRFALRYRINRGLTVEAGRIAYADTLGMAASGLFDGLRLEAALPAGALTAGAWYTGLLYKETAKILMTAAEVQDYGEPWTQDDLGSYFASRRALAALRWDMPMGEYHALSLEVLAQFDLNGNGETLHSQYGEVQAEFFPAGRLGITIGALVETIENSEGKFTAALGALGRLKTEVPGSLNDGFSLTVKFGSGRWNDTIGVFTPLSSPAQGTVFPGSLSGLGLIDTGYTARLHRTLLFENSLRYFIRTFDEDGAGGNRYGGELWASLIWQPLEDLRLSIGGGAFFPGLGNLYPAGTDPEWKLNAGLSLAF